MNEAEILRSILDWLKAHNINHWRVSLGGVRHGGVRKKNPMKGFPDVCGVIPRTSGRMFTIEAKMPKQGRFSPEQVMWQKRLEESGVLCLVATSVDDLELIQGVLTGKEQAC